MREGEKDDWKSIKDGKVTLIFKKGGKTQTNNGRPITWLNFDYKLLAKVIVNGLKDVIKKMTEEDQI